MSENHSLQDQITELREQLARLQSERVAVAPDATVTPVLEAKVSRRAALGKVAAVAATAVGAAVVMERPAAAANGGDVVLGQSNSATTATTIVSTTTSTGAAKLAALIYDGSSFTSSSSGYQAALGAWSDANIGLYAYSGSTYAASLIGPKGVIINGTPSITGYGSVPGSGAHNTGEFVLGSGGLSTCIISGTPGTWAHIGFNPTTGAARVVDSRTGTGTTKSTFKSGTPRTATILGHATIPDSPLIRAVAYSITVSSPSAGGYLKLGPTSSTLATVVNFTKGVSISASGITGLADDGTIIIEVFGASSDVVVDLTGYFV